MEATASSRARKTKWQKRSRAAFKARHGYSTTANYGAGGIREQILERDGRQCVKCGMTEQDHLAKWGRPITIDHKNKDRSNNAPDNLQTLCLVCHGRKDLITSLRVQSVSYHKDDILRRRANGQTYQRIADDLGFSVGAIWKWVKQWRQKT